jgi:hypothetical protein
MEKWRRTYPLESLQVEHHFHVEDVSITARPLLQFSNRSLFDAEGRRQEVLRNYRQRGYLVEEDAAHLVTFCNVTLYDLIAREVLPMLGYTEVSAMRHELARENIPVDYCVLIECPSRPSQSWTHLKHSRYFPQQVFWKRAVPLSEVQAGKVTVYTYAFPMHWVDAEVVYPYPIYGCLTGVGQETAQVLRHAVYARHLDEVMSLV